MLSGTLWPAHPHPLPGESLSCLIVRTAHANGVKVQTFCDQAFGNDFQIWNRDIDRNAPEWLLKIMSSKAGTPIKKIKNTTFRLYEKRLFPILHTASYLRWIMPIKHHHRLNTGYAIQYCPQCLAQDDIPYFRLAWRLAFYTFCPKHQIMMVDRCPHCGASIAFHRIELGRPKKSHVDTLDCCWQCEKKLSSTFVEGANIASIFVKNRWTSLLKTIDRGFYPTGSLSYVNLALLHQICRLISSKKYGEGFAKYISDKGGNTIMNMLSCPVNLELRPIQERHVLIEIAFSLTANRRKLKNMVKLEIIPLHMLYKDFEGELKEYTIKNFRN